MCIIMLAACVISCTGNGGEKAETSGTKPVDTDYSKYSDGLPAEYDMDGFKLTFLTREGFEEEITVDSTDADHLSDVINASVYNRQKEIESRFNCTIAKIVEPQDPGAFKSKIVDAVSFDSDEFDVAIGHIDYVASLAPDGYLARWQDIPHVDFDKPYWNELANSSLTVSGNSFFALGDINYWLILQCNCIYFNKELVTDYNIDDPYQTVLDGKWTLDTIGALTKKFYSDVNQNSTRDIDDFYAFTLDVHSGLNSYQNATENLMYVKDKEDFPQFKANTKRMGTLVEKMYNIIYSNESTYAAYDYSIQANEQTIYWWDACSYKYNNGTSIFVHGWLGNATNIYRDTPYEYGIIPLPKFDEKQKTYHTMMDASGPFMCIPRNIREDRADNVGMIIEAMACYGKNYITPAVFDTALKKKYSTLEGSGKMLDLIVDGLTFDFGYVHSSDYHNILRKVLYAKNSNLASYLGKAMNSLTTYYDKILDAYLDYGLE